MRMYNDYFGMKENAFTITPDPRYLFMSERHREAMAHLLFGTEEGGGFVQLTGEVGTGKTTICRAFLEELPQSVDVALLLSPPESPRDLILAIAAELQLSLPSADVSIAELVTVLNRRLLETHAAGRRTMVIIDEAQNILPEVLEQVRLLTNLETVTQKLLQVFLIGQPELRGKLQHPSLRQVSQRITARYHLEPLNLSETESYIRHRLTVAGCRQVLFNSTAIERIHRYSKGIPRVINILCDRALIGAYANEYSEVNGAIASHAAKEWRGDEDGWVLPFLVSRPATVIAMLVVLMTAGFVINSNIFSVYRVATFFNNEAMAANDLFSRTNRSPGASSSGKAMSTSNLSTPPVHAARLEGKQDEKITSVDALSSHDITSIANKAAFKALLQRWGINGNATDRLSLCSLARRHSLQCLNDYGSWETLRSYNRPAVLTLKHLEKKSYMTLVGMDRKYALVMTEEGVVSMPLRELRSYWTGEFMLFWQPPLGGVSLIAAGANEEAVQWLQKALQSRDGVKAPAKVFDLQLEQRLRNFQHSRGLVADGIAGPRTLIHLNNLLDHPQIPLLAAAYRNN